MPFPISGTDDLKIDNSKILHLKVYRIRSKTEYENHQRKSHARLRKIWEYESKLASTRSSEFSVEGVSYPANSMVNFHVDRKYSDGKSINWRERLICPHTGLNNRLRAAYQFFESELNFYDDDRVYITEKVTPFYNFLSTRVSHLVGSEYLGDTVPFGGTKNGILNEDLTRLSFENESFDIIMSFECLEHIPKFVAAISEICRCLKPGGSFMGSFPFSPQDYSNIIRATVNDAGKVIHFLEPEYHGDPVSEKGVLCYTIFGWEILDLMRMSGFKEAYAVIYWSDVFGYLGGEQFLFVARK